MQTIGWIHIAVAAFGVACTDIEFEQTAEDTAELAPIGGGNPSAVRAFFGTGNMTIPDNNTTGVTAVANVSDALTVAGLQVELDVVQTYVGDLRVVLGHNGIERVLHNNEGGSADNIQRTVTVTGFEGASAIGAWTLRIVDNAAQDVGTLRTWRLLVTPGTSVPPSDALVAVGRGGIDIPDNNTTGITAGARFDQDLVIGRLQIDLDVTHSYIGDLLISLSHNGITRVIHGNAGGSTDNIRATLDVSGFENAQARGDWTLSVKDTAATDVGRLNTWTLRAFAAAGGGGTNQSFQGAGSGTVIPDNTTTGISVVAVVPTSVTSGRVQIGVDISHTYQGDLVVSIAHQSGYVRTLHNATGGGVDNLVQTFALSDFVGSPAGRWTLHVVDNAALDVGTLNGWAVTISP